MYVNIRCDLYNETFILPLERYWLIKKTCKEALVLITDQISTYLEPINGTAIDKWGKLP